jgi:hypothetical protein
MVGTGAVRPANQGFSLALSADGNTVIVGGPFDNRAGLTSPRAMRLMPRQRRGHRRRQSGGCSDEAIMDHEAPRLDELLSHRPLGRVLQAGGIGEEFALIRQAFEQSGESVPKVSDFERLGAVRKQVSQIIAQ